MIAKAFLALARRANALVRKPGQSAWLEHLACEIERKQFPETLVDPFEDLFKADLSEEALAATANSSVKG